MQKETKMAVPGMMTCKIGYKWRHMKTLYWGSSGIPVIKITVVCQVRAIWAL